LVCCGNRRGGETCLRAAKGPASNRNTIGLIRRGGTLAGTAFDFAVA
jgi:hypothetical protein